MRCIWGLCLITLTAFTGIAPAKAATPAADNPPVVVELFTSQSCAPCLPENQLIRNISQKKGILPLTLPVSYLNIPGLLDPLSSSGTANRQKAYAGYRGGGSLSTPQIIINGEKEIVGNRARDARHAIFSSLSHPDHTDVLATLRQTRDGSYEIHLSETGPDKRHNAKIWLMSLQKEAKIQVRHGENKGHLLRYTNIVRDIVNVGSWHGELRLLHIPHNRIHLYPDPALVVLVQENGYGPILAADYYIPHKH